MHETPAPGPHGKDDLSGALADIRKAKEQLAQDESDARHRRRAARPIRLWGSGGWGKAQSERTKHKHYTHKARSRKRAQRKQTKASKRRNR